MNNMKCRYRQKGPKEDEFVCHKDPNNLDWCSYETKHTKLKIKDCPDSKKKD